MSLKKFSVTFFLSVNEIFIPLENCNRRKIKIDLCDFFDILRKGYTAIFTNNV